VNSRNIGEGSHFLVVPKTVEGAQGHTGVGRVAGQLCDSNIGVAQRIDGNVSGNQLVPKRLDAEMARNDPGVEWAIVLPGGHQAIDVGSAYQNCGRE
jgi:hypothetical protein